MSIYLGKAYQMIVNVYKASNTIPIDQKSLDDELRTSQQVLDKDIEEFNALVLEAEDALKRNDMEQIAELVIRIRIQASGIENIFDNLTDDLLALVQRANPVFDLLDKDGDED